MRRDILFRARLRSRGDGADQKMRVIILLVVLCFALALGTILSVSGVSSGGYMAVQYHVSWSSEVVGAGIVAAGPYWCAKDLVTVALTACMSRKHFLYRLFTSHFPIKKKKT